MSPDMGKYQGNDGQSGQSCADALDRLGRTMREIAEAEWAMYVCQELPDIAAQTQLHERLLEVREMLLSCGHPALAEGMPDALCRSIVETDAVVLSLRMRADRMRSDLKISLEEETGPPSLEDKACRIADFQAPIVREMLRRRNRCASELGTQDYATLLLRSMDVDMDELQHRLGETIRALGQLPSGNLGVDPCWTVYHHQIALLAKEQHMLVEFSDDTVELWSELVGIGASELRDALKREVGFAWCLPVDRPDDVRLTMGPERKSISLGLLLHELGHYLHYTAPVPESWQLTAPPAVFDETMACLLELAKTVVEFPGDFGRLVSRPAGRNDRLLDALMVRQCALSALFELRAYQADGESLDTLWSEILHEHGFAATFPNEWALDAFYIDDPVYRFNYVIGALWSAEELARMGSSTLQEVAARVRELGQAAYGSPWRRVLGMEESLPAPSAYIAWVKGRQP